MTKKVKYCMDDNDYYSYKLLLSAFGNVPYIQTEHWSTNRDFKVNPMLCEPADNENKQDNDTQHDNK